MIILSLQAENLLKYRSLRLNELPERGVIAVSGDNETGKSAIGEIICFALFGRTYSLAAADLRKLVRWGAIQGRVALKFKKNDQELEIMRHLDRGGEQSARLVRHDQPHESIVRGVEAVDAQMERILGYDFDEYINTFYLTQREITTPHPHSPSVKAMAGITPLERCAAEFLGEIEREGASERRFDRQIAELDAELAQLSPDRSRIDEIEQGLTHKSELQVQPSKRIDALNTAVDSYCRACRGLRFHAFRTGLAGFLHALIFFLLLATGGLWAVLLLKPGLWPLPAIRERLEEQISAGGLSLEPALGYLVAVLAGVLLFTWLWIFTLNLGMRRRRAQARRLGEEWRLVEELEPERMPFDPKIDSEAADVGDITLEHSPLLDKPDSERRIRLVARVQALEASPQEVRVAAQHEIRWMERGGKQLAAEREALAQTLRIAREDRERERQLQERRQALRMRLEGCRERIETQRLACELLQGAARQTADRFNEHLRKLVSQSLPRLTDGRYEYLQVNNDLQVRVYSKQKRSYLDLEEISSGTQSQIMLALRLSLAQERMSRIAKDRQFAFLDEPFAFFDDARMRGALRLLPELSELITQHWVVAQRFPGDESLALEIPCGEHTDTLEIGMPRRLLNSPER
jgi:exonuclease SbcC